MTLDLQRTIPDFYKGRATDNSDVKLLFDRVSESSYKSSGAGSALSTYQMMLSRIDRYGYRPVHPNKEMSGLTFITRPKLNLTTESCRQDRTLSWLATDDEGSIPYSIRCYLDTNYAKKNIAVARNAPFFASDSPFILPLTNCLMGISGFPDTVLDTETTEPGFFAEDQTMAIGSDFGRRTYDLNLTFRDIQGGYIFALLLTWIRWMGLVCEGNVVPYLEDINDRRLCYTCSIYRFVLDPSKRYIAKWGKATGCFPVNFPSGASFNINDNEAYVQSNSSYSVTFKCNHFVPMDPIQLREFNTIVTRFAGNNFLSGRVLVPTGANGNFSGIPYIDTESGTNELGFWAYPEELENPANSIIDQIRRRLEAAG